MLSKCTAGCGGGLTIGGWTGVNMRGFGSFEEQLKALDEEQHRSGDTADAQARFDAARVELEQHHEHRLGAVQTEIDGLRETVAASPSLSVQVDV